MRSSRDWSLEMFARSESMRRLKRGDVGRQHSLVALLPVDRGLVAIDPSLQGRGVGPGRDHGQQRPCQQRQGDHREQNGQAAQSHEARESGEAPRNGQPEVQSYGAQGQSGPFLREARQSGVRSPAPAGAPA